MGIFNEKISKPVASTDSNKKFSGDGGLQTGQLGVNYLEGWESIYIKNSEGKLKRLSFEGSNSEDIGYVNNSDVEPFTGDTELGKTCLDSIYDWIRDKRTEGTELYDAQDGKIYFAKCADGTMYQFVSPEPTYESLVDPNRPVKKHKKSEIFTYPIVRRCLSKDIMPGTTYFFNGDIKIRVKTNKVEFQDGRKIVIRIYKNVPFRYGPYIESNGKSGIGDNLYETEVQEYDEYSDFIFTFTDFDTNSYHNIIFHLNNCNSFDKCIIKMRNINDFYNTIVDEDDKYMLFTFNGTYFGYASTDVGEKPFAFYNSETRSPHLKLINRHIVNTKKTILKLKSGRVLTNDTIIDASNKFSNDYYYFKQYIDDNQETHPRNVSLYYLFKYRSKGALYHYQAYDKSLDAYNETPYYKGNVRWFITKSGKVLLRIVDKPGNTTPIPTVKVSISFRPDDTAIGYKSGYVNLVNFGNDTQYIIDLQDLYFPQGYEPEPGMTFNDVSNISLYFDNGVVDSVFEQRYRVNGNYYNKIVQKPFKDINKKHTPGERANRTKVKLTSLDNPNSSPRHQKTETVLVYSKHRGVLSNEPIKLKIKTATKK